jgi:hypothetical protein
VTQTGGLIRVAGTPRVRVVPLHIPRPHPISLEHHSAALQRPTRHLTRALALAPVLALLTLQAPLLAHIHLVAALTRLEQVLVAPELRITAANLPPRAAPALI